MGGTRASAPGVRMAVPEAWHLLRQLCVGGFKEGDTSDSTSWSGPNYRVTAKLANPGTTPVAVLLWNTPFEVDQPEYLSIAASDIRVPLHR